MTSYCAMRDVPMGDDVMMPRSLGSTVGDVNL